MHSSYKSDHCIYNVFDVDAHLEPLPWVWTHRVFRHCWGRLFQGLQRLQKSETPASKEE